MNTQRESKNVAASSDPINVTIQRNAKNNWVLVTDRFADSPDRVPLGNDADVLSFRTVLFHSIRDDVPVSAHPPKKPNTHAFSGFRSYKRPCHLQSLDEPNRVAVYRNGVDAPVLIISVRETAYLVNLIDTYFKEDKRERCKTVASSSTPETPASSRGTFGPNLDRDLDLLANHPATPEARAAAGRISVHVRNAGHYLGNQSRLDSVALDFDEAAAMGEYMPHLFPGISDVTDALRQLAMWAHENHVFLGQRVEGYKPTE